MMHHTGVWFLSGWGESHHLYDALISPLPSSSLQILLLWGLILAVSLERLVKNLTENTVCICTTKHNLIVLWRKLD